MMKPIDIVRAAIPNASDSLVNCNTIKKHDRGDPITLQDLESEIADVVIYIDLLSPRMGIDLAGAIANKFNRKSDEIGSPVKISGEVSA